MPSIKIYHLATCDTCQRIIKTLRPGPQAELQDIKTQRITPEQLSHLAELAGSYEALFSRRAVKYKEMGLATKQLSEADIRQLILDEYTFLKRPVVLVDQQIFIGNTPPVVSAAAAAIHP
jgi:arsenate reductase (glutaredoxin)